MGFFSRLFGWLTSSASDNQQERESPSEQPNDGGDVGAEPAEPRNDDPIGSIFGGGEKDSRDEQIEEDLKQFDPQDDSQGLFYLGWLDPNAPPDVREAARRKFEQEYGEWDPRKGRKAMSNDDWAKWRKYMGYAA